MTCDVLGRKRFHNAEGTHDLRPYYGEHRKRVWIEYTILHLLPFAKHKVKELCFAVVVVAVGFTLYFFYYCTSFHTFRH